MTDRQLREREGFALGQLLWLSPLGAIAGGLLGPAIARFLATWWDGLPVVFTLPRWLRWDWLGGWMGNLPWPSVATVGAVAGMLAPLAIFLWLARGIILDSRASSRSRLPVVDNFGAAIPRSSARVVRAKDGLGAAGTLIIPPPRGARGRRGPSAGWCQPRCRERRCCERASSQAQTLRMEMTPT